MEAVAVHRVQVVPGVRAVVLVAAVVAVVAAAGQEVPLAVARVAMFRVS